MSKTKQEIKDKMYYKDVHFLYEIFSSFKNVEETKLFIKDILTKSELRMLKRRWHIANLLSTGMDIRSVASSSRTSTQTVGKIKKILEEGTGGLKIAIECTKQKEDKEVSNLRNLRNLNKPGGGSKFVKGWFR